MTERQDAHGGVLGTHQPQVMLRVQQQQQQQQQVRSRAGVTAAPPALPERGVEEGTGTDMQSWRAMNGTDSAAPPHVPQHASSSNNNDNSRTGRLRRTEADVRFAASRACKHFGSGRQHVSTEDMESWLPKRARTTMRLPDQSTSAASSSPHESQGLQDHPPSQPPQPPLSWSSSSNGPSPSGQSKQRHHRHSGRHASHSSGSRSSQRQRQGHRHRHKSADTDAGNDVNLSANHDKHYKHDRHRSSHRRHNHRSSNSSDGRRRHRRQHGDTNDERANHKHHSHRSHRSRSRSRNSRAPDRDGSSSPDRSAGSPHALTDHNRGAHKDRSGRYGRSSRRPMSSVSMSVSPDSEPEHEQPERYTSHPPPFLPHHPPGDTQAHTPALVPQPPFASSATSATGMPAMSMHLPPTPSPARALPLQAPFLMPACFPRPPFGPRFRPNVFSTAGPRMGMMPWNSAPYTFHGSPPTPATTPTPNIHHMFNDQAATTADTAIDPNSTKRRKEQRWPGPGEHVCVLCGRLGAYVCRETGNRVCSQECKRKQLPLTASATGTPLHPQQLSSPPPPPPRPPPPSGTPPPSGSPRHDRPHHSHHDQRTDKQHARSRRPNGRGVGADGDSVEVTNMKQSRPSRAGDDNEHRKQECKDGGGGGGGSSRGDSRGVTYVSGAKHKRGSRDEERVKEVQQQQQHARDGPKTPPQEHTAQKKARRAVQGESSQEPTPAPAEASGEERIQQRARRPSKLQLPTVAVVPPRSCSLAHTMTCAGADGDDDTHIASAIRIVCMEYLFAACMHGPEISLWALFRARPGCRARAHVPGAHHLFVGCVSPLVGVVFQRNDDCVGICLYSAEPSELHPFATLTLDPCTLASPWPAWAPQRQHHTRDGGQSSWTSTRIDAANFARGDALCIGLVGSSYCCVWDVDSTHLMRVVRLPWSSLPPTVATNDSELLFAAKRSSHVAVMPLATMTPSVISTGSATHVRIATAHPTNPDLFLTFFTDGGGAVLLDTSTSSVMRVRAHGLRVCPVAVAWAGSGDWLALAVKHRSAAAAVDGTSRQEVHIQLWSLSPADEATPPTLTLETSAASGVRVDEATAVSLDLTYDGRLAVMMAGGTVALFVMNAGPTAPITAARKTPPSSPSMKQPPLLSSPDLERVL
ncbi:hypothetical protein PTSG_00003 [Salpingoeca rosetta]|uniref:HIT-type domain-containing protein n=1 Tax=Salpingoeca rosetta (strain ATCC 50818 / BSB-021) TaxID=946362 RepID=F2TV91_SALR5|nr:uncharacterized protein PTSG_00003 [Salpingoeca rosetta]EGD71987.1 hypothetical protein PTSG_00003 [Salpingoeca rosetta]|eukprot:XP_004998559.1 hypothetical protein PTSG_00003 [Salpingoeca rosetta]